jgi:hypothetical protein
MSGSADYRLVSATIGGLPIIDAVLDRLGLPALLGQVLPAADGRVKLAPAAAVRLVVTNLVAGRQPLCGLEEWAARFDPGLLGLTNGEVGLLNDDRGRAGVGETVRRRPGQPADHPGAACGDRVPGRCHPAA